MKPFALLALVITLGAATSTAQLTGKDVVKKMVDRYAGKWYRTLVFTLKMEDHRIDGTVIENQYVSIHFPGRRRVDLGPTDSCTFIHRGDSTYRFVEGKLKGRRPYDDEITFFLGGLFTTPPPLVYTFLTDKECRLEAAHEDVWAGRPVYVIGANKGEEGVNQLWVDKENLYPIRWIKVYPTARFEARFEDWKSIGSAWLATKSSYYEGERLIQVDHRYNWKTDIPLDERIFDPVHWISSH